MIDGEALRDRAAHRVPDDDGLRDAQRIQSGNSGRTFSDERQESDVPCSSNTGTPARPPCST
jgi:hypothetical protein